MYEREWRGCVYKGEREWEGCVLERERGVCVGENESGEGVFESGEGVCVCLCLCERVRRVYV